MDKLLLKAALQYADNKWAVFPLVPGSKIPFQGSAGFKDATIDRDQIHDWWDKDPAANIGIATGSTSNVFVLDVDKKDADGFRSLEALTSKHGKLPETRTIQTPNNGRHYYFQMPQCSVGNAIGRVLGPGIDVRGNGGYVVAPPSAIDELRYRVSHAGKPAVAPAWLIELLCRDVDVQTNYSIPTSLHPYTPTSLHNTESSVVERIASKRRAEGAFLAAHPDLGNLYHKIIEGRLRAIGGDRNRFVVEAITFLYRVTAPAVAIEIVGLYYDSNRMLFKSSRQQHIKEANEMLKYVSRTYSELLTSEERQIYNALPEHERDAFRICRDLAKRPTTTDAPAFTFYLGFCHLGARLGLHGQQAQRIIRNFEAYGLLKLLKRGTRRTAGMAGTPGVYEWLLR